VRRLLLLAALLAGCGDLSSPPPGFELRIVPESLTVEATLTATLDLAWVDATGQVIPLRGRRVQWFSSDESIVDVREGQVQALEVGQAEIVAVLDTAVARADITVAVRCVTVAAGDYTCGVTRQGSLYCWDDPDDAPDRMDGPSPFRSVSVGSAGTAGTQWWLPGAFPATHACAVDTTGSAHCWGANGYGQLGDGTTDDAPQPQRVTGSLVFETVTAGSNHSCGITVAGDAYCWGLNSLGELGIGQVDQDAHPAPELVVEGLRWTAITAGDGFTCGLTDTRRIYCWGDGRYGALGDGSSSGVRSDPAMVVGDHSWSHLDAGPRQVCAIDVRQDLYCWGVYPSGTIAVVPTRRDLQYYYRSVSAGGGETDDFACAIATAGQTYCWGGAHGQFGIFDRYRPARPWAFVALAAGALHTCGLTDTGLVYCWGAGYGLEPKVLPYQLPEAGDQTSRSR
jgi:alpha-tubulin suppressor-like RCC1 family protein